MPSSSASTRFDRHVVLVPNGCLLWTAALNAAGYGWFKWDGKAWLAHRAAWVLAGRTLTDGLDLHHRCFSTWCVNVDHLSEVTPSENRSLALKPGIPDMCGADLHPWVPENWYHRASGPICKPCHLERQRRYDRGRKTDGSLLQPL